MSKLVHLDGMRGIAALWVLLGHAMLLSGFVIPIIGQPDLGVDLFILLSGFLMVYQAQQREHSEDWSKFATWGAFWARRFFRIAPLFYALLFVALIAGPWIYADRIVIDTALGRSLQVPNRYLDASATNVLLHVSFIFGLLPSYAFRTPLPDWSLGLEMQFYAVFPFIFLLARRTSWFGATGMCILASAALALVLRKSGVHFPMPSLLVLKLHLFFCGMLVAANRFRTPGARTARFFVIVGLATIPIGGQNDILHLVVREAIVIGFYAVNQWRSIATVEAIAKLLASPPLKWMGDVSYSVYLLHLLIMHRVAAMTLLTVHSNGFTRFLIVAGVTSALTYSTAWATFRWIEEPAGRLGKRLIGAFTGSRKATPVAAENIAAP